MEKMKIVHKEHEESRRVILIFFVFFVGDFLGEALSY